MKKSKKKSKKSKNQKKQKNKKQKKWKTAKNEKPKKNKKKQTAVFFCPSGGTTFHLSSVGWCCLVHSSLGVVLRPALSSSSFGRCCFSNLLSGGPAFLSLLWRGAAFLPPPVGGAAFLSLLWIVVLFASLRLGGAAWSPLGGVAFPISSQGDAAFLPLFLVGLPSTTSSGWSCFFSTFWRVVLLGFLLLWVVLLFHSPVLPSVPSFV